MPTVLVVGASRGIGRELVRQYVLDGWRVHATTRSPAGASPPPDWPPAAILHEVEVRDDRHADRLARALAGETLDVYVHNAGVHGTGMTTDELMAVNAEAPIQLAERLLDAAGWAPGARIVLMSSQMGARRGRRGSLGGYGDSKAALNDSFRARAPAWGERGVTAIVMHPGWVRTDMGGTGGELSVHESATSIRRTIDSLSPADHGRFLTWQGHQHPW